MNTEHLIKCLEELPQAWALVPCNANKTPILQKWQKKPPTRDEVAELIRTGRARAVGVLAGPLSGGLLFVDVDGSSADELLKKQGVTLPPTLSVTSGTQGRKQLIYNVPERFWSLIRTAKFQTGRVGNDGATEQLELRWAGQQSIVIGAHPATAGYFWLPGLGPGQIEVADAPEELLKLMHAVPAPTSELLNTRRAESEKALSALQALAPGCADSYDVWLAVGMALHSVGDPKLYPAWVEWSKQSSRFELGDCEKEWSAFSENGGITIATLYKLASLDGWCTAKKNKKKLEKLTAGELEIRLKEEKIQEFRLNELTQQIEQNGRVLEDVETFYIDLQHRGIKIGKEGAIHVLARVARRNKYNPVLEYLQWVEANVAPADISKISGEYLRLGDEHVTIFDEMMMRTLVAAVKRCYEPGCKHDTACVLLGEQGVHKSTFWEVLGGPYFSDTLTGITSFDDIQNLHSGWISEWSELESLTTKKQASQVKSFLSRKNDFFRAPYARTARLLPRRGIVVGTTNKTVGLLVDDDNSGNRRFWVIPTSCTALKPIDTERLAKNRDAIWSGAVAAYKAGENTFLSKASAREVEVQNSEYVVEHPWVALIEEWVQSYQPVEFTSKEVLGEAIGKQTSWQTKADEMEIGRILRAHGYAKTRVSSKAGRRVCWRKQKLK